MATGGSGETLESQLNQVTDPSNQEDRWDCIQGFYQLVNQESDGPQVAIRLLAHKIQSPQEKEALQALTLLEACMNNCGKRFHSEVAKFRFLNELIKILSPKYFGTWTPQAVKDRLTEVLYGWTLWLKEEPKILEAYNMLKKQGLIKKDPKLPSTVIMAPPPDRSIGSVFDHEDKAELLARLLKSGRPEDLETANRLIKNTVKEEQEKAEKASKRECTLKEVERSAKQLRDMLEQHDDSNDIKAVYESCDRLRPSLFRLASDTMDDDAALAQILAANDELTLVVNAYKERVGRGECNGRRNAEEITADKNKTPTCPREIKSYHLIDLSALDAPQSHSTADSPLAFEPSSPPAPSRLDSAFQSVAGQDFTQFDSYQGSKASHNRETPMSYYDELMQLNGDFHIRSSEQCNGRGPALTARGFGASDTNNLCSENQHFTSSKSPSKTQKSPNDRSGAELIPEDGPSVPHSLKNIFVPMETVRPSQLEPITLFDRGGVHVSLHFTRDPPPGHPAVAVVVISTVNTSALDVRELLFQVSVPKTVLVKLQPASMTHLPPYNPLLPPPAISQVLLLANPQACKVRLRYKLTLTHGEQHVSETSEIHDFPEWGSLIGR